MNQKHKTRHLEAVYSGLYLGCLTAKQLPHLIRRLNLKMQRNNAKTSDVATREQIRLEKVETRPTLPLSITVSHDKSTSYPYKCPIHHVPQCGI